MRTRFSDGQMIEDQEADEKVAQTKGVTQRQVLEAHGERDRGLLIGIGRPLLALNFLTQC